MELRQKAFCLRRAQDALALLVREDARLAEDIDERREMLICNARQDSLDDEVHIIALPSLILGRHSMRAEIRPHDACRQVVVEPLHDAQQPQFCLEVEPVAALALDRRHAEREHVRERPFANRIELVLARRACRLHRADDAAAPPQELEIWHAREPVVKFLRPRTREEEMRVRIDEARHGRLARRILHLCFLDVDACGLRLGHDVRVAAGRTDRAVLHPDSRVCHELDVFHFRPALCLPADRRRELGDMTKEEISHRIPLIPLPLPLQNNHRRPAARVHHRRGTAP